MGDADGCRGMKALCSVTLKPSSITLPSLKYDTSPQLEDK
jgi:hypothetical protein